MGTIQRIRDNQRRRAAAHHRVAMRIAWPFLAILGPAFVVGGVLALLGFGNIESQGMLLEGADRVPRSLTFLMLGVAICVVRFVLPRLSRRQP
jgi:hypothetical protein